jgi:SAM-dependent methyltransferase
VHAATPSSRQDIGVPAGPERSNPGKLELPVATVQVVDTAAAWEAHADSWLAWSDPAQRDGFWTDTWPTVRQMLPPPSGLTLDVGCGEGRGARELSAIGYRVVGIDRSPTLVAAAAERGSTVVLGDAGRLPFVDGCASLVFASMSLLDIDDLESAINEIGRVLQPGGSLVAAIVHPAISTYEPSDLRTDTARLPAPYLTSRQYRDDVTSKHGVRMVFTSVHRPIQAYLGPLFKQGLVISDFREGGDGPLPWLLTFRADRPAV